LAQRGEVDLAIPLYEKVLQSGLPVYDPVSDLSTLLVRTYGEDGAVLFVKKRMKNNTPTFLYLYALQTLSESLLPEVKAVLKEPQRDALPLCGIFVQKAVRIGMETRTWTDTRIMKTCYDRVLESAESGEYYNFYIDQIRAQAEVDKIRTSGKQVNGNNFFGSFDHRKSSFSVEYQITESGKQLALRFDSFHDRIDETKPIKMCSDKQAAQTCIDLRQFVCAEATDKASIYKCIRRSSNRKFWFLEGGHIKVYPLLGSNCISSLSYTDINEEEISIKAPNTPVHFLRNDDKKSLLPYIKDCGYILDMPDRD
jgi:hypothetical protein